jgi:hypothetical protein
MPVTACTDFAESKGVPSRDQFVPSTFRFFFSINFEEHPIHFPKPSIDLNQTTDNWIHTNVYVGWAESIW